MEQADSWAGILSDRRMLQMLELTLSSSAACLHES